MRYTLISIVLMSVFFIAGCNLISPDPAAVMPVDIPDAYVHTSGIDTPQNGKENMDGGWWHQFGVDELSRLIQTGLGANYDLNVLKARADQALANVKRETSNLGPTLHYSLGGQQNYAQSKTSDQSRSSNHDHSYSASLAAGYTLDLWGKNRADVNARELEYLAACQDLANGALTLSTDIADTWVDIVSVRTRMQVLARQIEANRMTLTLQELRFINGMATALDVSQQRQALAQVRSAMPLLEKEEKQLINALGLYLGRTPGTPAAVSTTDLPQTFLVPQPGIPADLLENRADIRAARMRLEAAALDVEAAKADLLPELTLSGSAAFSSGSLDLLFQNWVVSLGAALAGPLLDSGARKAEIERTRAVVREEINTYAQTVANAIREVEDALVAIDRQKAYIDLLEQQLAAVRVTMQNARIQYLNGQSSYLNYLSAWATMENLERQLVSEKATYVKERIALYNVTGRRGAFFKETPAQDKKTGGN
ncbi:efflux transporter outer membrane subunit [Desulfobacter latus]|uniref:Efflux transporter outer membrane subunit n=1 Tax=Desulfobacter latus TaxID=2292 RepID=A0A850T5X4_9BACT|nr:efflux transporter outer membrane subunit [Desulfobacter latus]NWH03718.1 efflux transporter outer membrane subunit [Desulfobacter latus]